MCFPNKRQKDNFNDTTQQNNIKAATSAPASSSQPPTSTTAPTNGPPVLPPPTITETKLDMSSPKVAIVIYTMYGHIAKSVFMTFFAVDQVNLISSLYSGRGC